MTQRDFVRSLIQHKEKQKNCSFVHAAKIVKNDYSHLAGEINSLLDEHASNAKHGLNETMALREISTPDENQTNFKPWYFPDGSGIAWGHFKNQAIKNGLAEVIDEIDKQSTAVVQRIANPDVPGDKRKGLVVGYVQSGKTANYAATIAKAVDEGYRFVIVLAGIHNNLRNQTQNRLIRDLGIGNQSGSELKWYTLTYEDEDMSSSDHKNAETILSGGGVDRRRVIAVVKKNSHILKHLLSFLGAAGKEVTEKIPTLIIDDESDQASPDASAKTTDSPTTINRLIRQIWNKFAHGTYIGYTATPFANVFINPDDSRNKNLPDLYPSDFIYPLPRPNGYFGAEELFGIDIADPETTTGDSEVEASVVRSIPGDDAEALKVPSDIQKYHPTLPPSLKQAIKWFLIATAGRKMRDKKAKHSTMLVHVTHKILAHRAIADAIATYLDELRRPVLDGDTEQFKTVFEKEIDKASALYDGNGEAITWSNIQSDLIHTTRKVQVAIDNSEASDDERLNYTGEKARTVIVVGGGTLSRGLTLEGLISSFFMRETPNYDTLIQMGRWFGFRKGYEDLQRIWVTDQLRADYRFLAKVEAELRHEITDHIREGMPPSQIGPAVIRHPGRLQITSANKMKWAQPDHLNFDGRRIQTTMFDLNLPGTFGPNFDRTVELLQNIVENPKIEESTQKTRWVANGVPLEYVTKYLGCFTFHPGNQSYVSEALKWANTSARHRTWNIQVASGEREQISFANTGIKVNMVNRSPFRIGLKEKEHENSKTMDIRSLSTAGDKYADLDRIHKGETKFEYLTRRYRAGGSGLLIIYPISKYSNPQHSRSSSRENAQMRAKMSDLLNSVNPQLATGPSLQQPLIGLSIVMPVTQEGLNEFGGAMRVNIPSIEEGDQ